MALTTKDKITFLQKFVKEWQSKIYNSHAENIVGFRVGKKVKNGKAGRNYSIIVQVAKKLDERMLSSESIIPKKIEIEFPDKKKRIVETDIEQTGKFNFHSGIASEIQSKYSIHFGSAGLFVADDSARIYALTNYHVVAESFISAGKMRYSRPVNRTRTDVKLIDRHGKSTDGRFELGLLSHEIDAAFVELFIQPGTELNRLPDGKRIRGRVSDRPLPPSLRHKKILVYSYHNPDGAESVVFDNSAVLRTNNPRIFFTDIIQIRPRITQGGDSGGLVLLPTLSVLGIIVGADDLSTYAIPFYKIDDFKNVNIL